MANKSSEQKYPEVLMPCRRGHDLLTEGQKCDSKMAYNLSEPGSRTPSFKCVKCSYRWVVQLGGKFVGA